MDRWRMIAAHSTIEEAQEDLWDYEMWSKTARTAWTGFRVVKVTKSREVILIIPNAGDVAATPAPNDAQKNL